MSYITLQFGQCGNQIGQALYECIYEDIKLSSRGSKKIYQDYINEATNKWFNVVKGKLEAKSVLIDTENKVTALANNQREYKFKNIVSKAYGGCANNWAYGYNVRSDLVIEEVLEKVRQELENSDYLSSIINILSSSGGTGSGVGSKVIEKLREVFPSKFITNVVVLPYKNGDVVTQNYNTLLTLSKLYDISDAIMLFENDKVHQICNKVVATKDVKFTDLNAVIAEQLVCLTQPVKFLTFSKVISSVSSHPSYKFIQVLSAPHINKEHVKYEPLPNWSNLVSAVVKRSKCDIALNPKLCRRIKYVGNLIVTRGSGSLTDSDMKRLLEPSYYPPWVPDYGRVSNYCQQKCFMDFDKYLSLVSNSNSICSSLDFILENSWNLFVHDAYIHHYKKFNVDDEYFMNAFQKLENVLSDYKLL